MEFIRVGGTSTKWNAKTIEERIKKIEQLVHRQIPWSLIRQHASKGQLIHCEICGEHESGGFHCKPCIHPRWCCICCILLGIPNYETSVLILGEKKK